MTNPQSPKRNFLSWLPDTSSGFWRFCLLASLMLNLLVAGLVGGIYFRGPPMMGQRYGQFVPRKFFGELDHERRRELSGLFRDSKPDFEKLRHAGEGQATQLAAELTNANYDATKVNALIDSFTTGQDSVAAKSGAVLKDFFAKLKPEERVLLAKAIQERAGK
jgi:uncharacterized membrane protein